MNLMQQFNRKDRTLRRLLATKRITPKNYADAMLSPCKIFRDHVVCLRMHSSGWRYIEHEFPVKPITAVLTEDTQ